MKKQINNIINFIKMNTFKFNISCLITGLIYFIFALLQPNEYSYIANIFAATSGFFLSFWLITIKDKTSRFEIIIEIVLLILFIFASIFSLNFTINTIYNTYGIKLITNSALSCIGIFYCIFYLISKFSDIYNFIKNIFNKLKNKLFGSSNETSKIKSAIQNITALLVAISGLAVAIKAIIEPLLKLINDYFS